MADTGGAFRQLSVDEMAMLTDEIAALARCGIPLESGLAGIRGDLPRRLQHAVNQLSERLAAGEPLPQALTQIDQRVSPLLVAVVESGLASGRLPAMLEELSRITQWRAELQRQTLRASIYPLFVLIVAVAVTALFGRVVLPAIADGFASLRLAPTPVVRSVLGLDELTFGSWALIGLGLVAGIALFLVAFPRVQRRAWRTDGPRARLPVFGKLFTQARTSYFAATLGLLVDEHVPLPAAFELAGKASGNRVLAAQSDRVAARLRRGEALRAAASDLHSLPSLFRWTLVTAEQTGHLGATMKRSAENYYERAVTQAESVRLILPVVLMLGVAGLATLCCLLVLFYPWTVMLYELAEEPFSH